MTLYPAFRRLYEKLAQQIQNGVISIFLFQENYLVDFRVASMCERKNKEWQKLNLATK